MRRQQRRQELETKRKDRVGERNSGVAENLGVAENKCNETCESGEYSLSIYTRRRLKYTLLWCMIN